MSAAVEPKSESARTWYRRGAAAEAALRAERRQRLPIKVRHLLTFMDKHATAQAERHAATVADALCTAVYVFRSEFTRAERRRLRRALRGKS